MQKKKQTYNWHQLMSELVDIADKELDEDCIDCKAGSMIAPDCSQCDKIQGDK